MKLASSTETMPSSLLNKRSCPFLEKERSFKRINSFAAVVKKEDVSLWMELELEVKFPQEPLLIFEFFMLNLPYYLEFDQTAIELEVTKGDEVEREYEVETMIMNCNIFGKFL